MYECVVCMSVCVCMHACMCVCMHGCSCVCVCVCVCDISCSVHSFSFLLQLIVRGAGHILPYDQPERALDMVRRFISGKGF